MIISVILCTHNPRISVLSAALKGLGHQTLDPAHWELLLIDNASDFIIADQLASEDLPALRYIREDTLGLTPARLCGIREAQGELLVFVDDDNVLAPSYLEEALNIYREHPKLGAYGGSIFPEFETPPPEWTRPYWYLLAIRETPEDHVSMQYGDAAAEPCGAGLCVRREIADRYASYLSGDSIRRALDRSGDSLASAGDMDLVYTAFDCDYEIGRFRSLVLDHLIPPSRLTEKYFLRIFEAMFYSGTLLNQIRGISADKNRFSIINILRRLKRFVFSASMDRKMMLAERRGRKRALIDWSKSATS